MLNTLVQSGNLLRHISPDSCQRECLFLMLERYTRFTLLNDHSFTAPIGVSLSLWLHFSIGCQMMSFGAWHTTTLDSISFRGKRLIVFFLSHINSAWLNATWHKSWICLYPKCRCKVSKLKLPHPYSLLSYSHPQSSNFFYFLISKNIGVIVLWLLNFPHLELAQTPKEATILVTSAKTVTQVKFPCSMCLRLNQQS